MWCSLIDEVYSTFGLTYHIELSTMPEDHMGDEEVWQFADQTACRLPSRRWARNIVINEGDGAFYGPKLDFHSGRLHGPYLAVRHHPAGYPDARAL